jgi:glycosyltransferase XagB
VVQTNSSTPLVFGGIELEHKLQADDQNVLPHLSRRHLHEALQRIQTPEIETVLQHHVVPVAWLPGLVLYASCSQRGVDFARHNNLKLVAQVWPSDFQAMVRLVWGKKLLQKATLHLARKFPDFSARQQLTPTQLFVLAGISLCLVAASASLSFETMWGAASAIIGLFFFSVVMLRLFCVLPRSSKRPIRKCRATDAELPTYSVLVPVFKEVVVLDQLIWALTQLDYPRDKLDIKIITEESDTSMRRALERYDLPAYFEVIVVPRGKPQTKPRALNYALQFCRGELLTIYDAEDIPDPQQLYDAAGCFMSSSDNSLACVQAQLAFFNSKENWLTRQFTAEYATLFGVILPKLAAYRLPLPLGGTSNHFRTDILRKIGGWDSFNVTEDADLGLRLARCGFTTGVIDSLTYEEANTQCLNWLKQRARWLKGFLQTWLVHMRNPVKTARQIGPFGFWVLQSCTIGVFVSALFHPFLLALTVYLLCVYPPFSHDASLWVILVSGLNLLMFILGYGISMFAARKALRLRGFHNWWGTIAMMPLYWFLMSAAGWLALYQFIVSPFEWNKTEHGLSKKKDRV